MRISKVVLGLLALIWLTACASGNVSTRDAPTQIQLPDGTVIAGANGWCVDQTTLSPGSVTSVVVLGSCAALSGDARRPQPDIPGVVTVSVEVQAGTFPDGEMLQKFFVSDAGRAALSRDGEADSVDILETRFDSGMLFLHASDKSAAPGASNEVWRALFGLGGRFVAVALYTRPEDKIGSEDGLATLQAQVAELRAANRG